MPERAPAFFFIDIQNDQVARFDELAAAIPGVGEIARVPSLRARIVAVNGVPAEQVQTTEDTAWALRGDRGLTYAADPPEGTRLVAGSWLAAVERNRSGWATRAIRLSHSNPAAKSAPMPSSTICPAALS